MNGSEPIDDNELCNARNALQVYEAAVIAFDNAHEVLDTIMRAADRGTARMAIERRYGFTEVQTQAVMDMQLQRLTVADRLNIEQWRDEEAARVARLERSLNPE